MPRKYTKLTEGALNSSIAALLGLKRPAGISWAEFATSIDEMEGVMDIPARLGDFVFLAEMVPVVGSIIAPKKNSLLVQTLTEYEQVIAVDTNLRGKDSFWLCYMEDNKHGLRARVDMWMRKQTQGVMLVNKSNSTPMLAIKLNSVCGG